jgi:hypothetical protein
MRTTATIGLLLVLLLGGISRLSAQEITFQATVDRNTIAVGEHVKLSITLTNARGSFGAPDLGGMMVVQGPFESTNMSIINGRMSGSVTRTWLLTAAKPGRYTIGPVQAKVGGGTIQTEPIVVEVTKGNAPRSGDPQAALGQQRDPNLFTTISLSRNKGYVGEQVIATYMLYSRYANLQSVPKEMPKISNAWVEEVDLGEPHWEDKLETINGVQYRVAVLRKQVLFPQRSGTLRIEPFVQTCVIDRSFFNPGRNVEVRSNVAEYTVLDLPPGASSDFNGAVGELEMTVAAARTQVEVDGSVDISVRFTGRTNLKLLEAPVLELPSDLEVYDPKVVDRISANASGMSGSREFQYLIIPRHDGTFELPAIQVSYFDTKTGTYRTLSSEPITLEVAPGNGNTSAPVPQRALQSDVQLLGTDIRHIRTGNLQLREKGRALFGSWAWAAGMTAPALGYVLLLGWHRRRTKAAQDVVGTRRKQADKVAQRHLAQARLALDQNERDAFYNALSRALNGYLGDKFGLGPAESMRENIQDRLSGLPNGTALAQRYSALITACDLARFAPIEDTPRGTLYQQAAELIGTIEQQFRA